MTLDEQARALAIAIMERPEGYDPALLIGEERAWYDAKLPLILAALLEAKAQGMEECLDIVKVRIQQRVEAISITSLIRADVVRRKLSREIEELQEVVNEIRARAAAIREGKP